MTHLGLFFLGLPEVKLDGQQVLFATRKATALLAYLSLTGDPHMRDTLATLLWPELDQERSRASLRHALWSLKRAGLEAWVQTEGESVSLKAGYQLDVIDFLEKAAQARSHAHPDGSICSGCAAVLSQAAELYRADFLTGFSLRDSAAFDDWQAFQSESLRQQLAEVLESLVGWHGAAGEVEQAGKYARRWVSLDQLHEPAQRALMRVYALAGKRGLALKQYENLRELLDRELGVEPEDESQRLYKDIQAGNYQPLASRTSVEEIPVRPLLRGDPRVSLKPAAPVSHQSKMHAELQVLLNKVKNFWVEGVLNNSLHNAVLLGLDKQFDLKAVRNPWQMVLEIPDQQSQTIPRNAKISDIFQKTNRALLILGAPGSGKTTTLIDLASALIDLAEADEILTQPIPVILNLSSWAENRPPLMNWVVEELSMKYHIPRRIGKAWLEDNRLALLLDGLDEVESKYRAACIETINAFIKTCGLAGIAVCSRIDEYSNLPTRLELYGAIRLLPLSLGQIEDYFTKVGVELKDLASTLHSDEQLREFISTPLMLSIITFANQSLEAEGLFLSKNTFTVGELRDRLFDIFINRVLDRKGASALPYSKSQITGWLSWLAKGMIKHNHTIFLIEDLQPSWLQTKKQRLAYFLGSRVTGCLILVMGFSIRGLIWNRGYITLLLWVGGILSGLIVGFIDAVHFEQSLVDDHRTIVLSPFWSTVSQAVLVTLIGGVTLGIFDLTSQDTFHPLLGVAFGLVFGLWKNRQSISQDIQTVEATGFTWTGALKGMVYGLLVTTFYFLLILVKRHFGSADEPVGILNALTPLSIGLVAIFGLIVGVMIGAISSSTIVIKVLPNQGMRLSLKKALFPGFMFGLLLGLIWAYMEYLFYSNYSKPLGIEPYERIAEPVFFWINALLFGSTLFLWFGGFDVIKHLTLRFILALNDKIPWHYARFLDFVSTRLFLQKVGGGYSFIHRYLMEHFVDL